MSRKNDHSALEKEFELERVILFSDAVFAIAITLLVIDIKFPDVPSDLSGVDLHRLFRPTIIGFAAFAISFFFIGRSWSNHLALFRLVRKYDQGMINRNLLFLFFIVIFPFTASGVSGQTRDVFLLPLFLYLFNLAGVSIAHLALCHYIIYGKSNLAIEGEAMQKKYIYLRGKVNAISMSSMAVLLSIISLLFPGNGSYIEYACIFSFAVIAWLNKRIRKYKPAPVAAG